MTLDPFGQPRPAGCKCRDGIAHLRAAFEERELPRCPVHEGSLEDEARDASLRALIAEYRTQEQAATPPPPTVEELLRRALAGEFDPPQPPALAPVIALNSADLLARALGAGSTDLPPTAA